MRHALAEHVRTLEVASGAIEVAHPIRRARGTPLPVERFTQ
jgi:hypothetical protein